MVYNCFLLPIFLLLCQFNKITSLKLNKISHEIPTLAIDEDPVTRALSVIKRDSGQIIGIGCCAYAGMRLIKNIYYRIRPSSRPSSIFRGDGSYHNITVNSIAKEQEELWHLVDNIFRGQETRLSELSNRTDELETLVKTLSNSMEDCVDEVKGVDGTLNMAMSSLSDRVIALEQKNQDDNTSKQSSLTSEEVEKKLNLLRRDIVSQLNNIKKTTESGQVELSKLQKSTSSLENIKNKIAEQDSKVRKLEKVEKDVKTSLQELLQQHDENIASKLRSYGDELKSALRDSMLSSGGSGGGSRGSKKGSTGRSKSGSSKSSSRNR